MNPEEHRSIAIVGSFAGIFGSVTLMTWRWKNWICGLLRSQATSCFDPMKLLRSYADIFQSDDGKVGKKNCQWNVRCDMIDIAIYHFYHPGVGESEHHPTIGDKISNKCLEWCSKSSKQHIYPTLPTPVIFCCYHSHPSSPGPMCSVVDSPTTRSIWNGIHVRHQDLANGSVGGIISANPCR